jgi:hypothetical protein
MPTVETSLGHLVAVCEELALTDPIKYVFKLGCGCSVYTKEDVLGHLWDKCENQGSDFWSERYMEYGRTIKHHVRVDEIDNIWAGADVTRDEVERLRARDGELDAKLVWKNTHDYVRILQEFPPTEMATMSILEEKKLRTKIEEWYLREDIKPPELEMLHTLALAKIAAINILSEFNKGEDVERLTLFGFGDDLAD